MHDFQFFNREELGELVQEEERLEQRRKDAQSLARELKQKGKKAQDEANAKAKAAGQEPSPCAEAEACVEIKILRRVRAESSRRPPRHRRDACSMAWRCEFLTARPSQDGRVIAEK